VHKTKHLGSRHIVLKSITTVALEAKLVDTKTGTLLWESSARVKRGFGGSVYTMVTAPVRQIMNSKTDYAHSFCPLADQLLFATSGKGILVGSRHSFYGWDHSFYGREQLGRSLCF
jgi:hypothetical protein